MSKREDAAFKEWGEALAGEIEDSEQEALTAWLAMPIAREVFRGTIGQKELYRRMNEVETQKREIADREVELNEWYETNAPVVEELAREKEELKAQLAKVSSGGPPPAEGTGVTFSKDELAAINAKVAKVDLLDKLIPSVLTDMGRVLKDSIKNNFDVDPGEVIQLSLKNRVEPWRAYLELTSEEREARAVTAKEEEKKRWFDEGRRSVTSNSPDHFQPSGPSMVDFLQELNKGAAAGGKDPLSSQDRVSSALKELQNADLSD
jgi:hypothetical protein